VVCHNAFAYFWDAVTLSTYGSPKPGYEAVAIDIYNNLIHMVNDDFIESDGGVHNIRVMRNLGVNAAHNAFSAQPVFGGPAYFIRNIVYRSRGALKFADASPAGLVVYHNTFVAEVAGARHSYSNVHYRNNLVLGADTPKKPIAVFRTATPYSSFDYDGFRPNRSVSRQFLWFPPAAASAHHAALGVEQALAYPSLQAFSEATGHERHGVEVDYDVFENLRQPDVSRPNLIYHVSDLNFNLKPGSRAVDAGLRLPNVNDDYTGQAPDLGARELGRPVPVYGPRGMTSVTFYR
jgi:hypothetical protein